MPSNPGYDRVGLAIVDDGTLVHSACIVTDKKDLQEVRLKQVYDGVCAIIDRWQPTHLALETLFFSVNKKTAIKVAESRGVIVLVAGIFAIPLIELSPQKVKLAMAGVGNASKEQVQKMVQLTLQIDISKKLDDEIDAIALAFAAVGEIKRNTLEKGLAK